MSENDDREMSEEELALAREGEELVRAAAAPVRAPQSLRERIEDDRARAAKPLRGAPFWRRRRIAIPVLAAVALGAVALAAWPSGGGGPSFRGVDAVASLAPTEAPPPPSGGDPPVLGARVGPVEFPDWRSEFGWRAVGRRSDEVSGRAVTTVFYRNRGAGLGYAIVHGEALGGDPAGDEIVRDGKTYHVDASGGRTVVTWTQAGHTCVIVASPTVPRAMLVDLAASRNA